MKTIEEKALNHYASTGCMASPKEMFIAGYTMRHGESQITEQNMIDAICDVLGLEEEDLCLEDKLNYHVPILYVLEAMKRILPQPPKNNL